MPRPLRPRHPRAAMAEPPRPQRKLSRVGESLYRVLGLQKGSSPEEIKKAYRYGGARPGLGARGVRGRTGNGAGIAPVWSWDCHGARGRSWGVE